LGLPAEAKLTPRAAERVARETAVQKFDPAARALSIDWGFTVHGRQTQRWAQALGGTLVQQRDREVQAYRRGVRPTGPANDPALLVMGLDGGRVQGKDPDAESGSRWREDKVATLTTYLPGDGKDKDPEPLVSSTVATMRDAAAFGPMVRLEAERRGVRQAVQLLAICDGGNWIDPLLEKHFGALVRIIDWCHASEHLWDCAKAAYGTGTVAAAQHAERWEAWLWDGKVTKVIAVLQEESDRAGAPQTADGPEHPRRVLSQNVGYFTRHQNHMRYPEYRAKGWPIGSGVTEAAVKQFNKRVKGTEQFWRESLVEPILMLRAAWISQDDRWNRYWANRPAYCS
jgi:hypothetical protein